MKRVSFLTSFTSIVALLTASVVPFLAPAHPANAVSASDWQAGHIMDSSVFRDKDSMSVDAIQRFLNSKVPTCDTNGTKTSEYGGGTRAQYGAAHNAPAPYICLKDYSEGGRSAAQIIWDAGQQYNINPQALITLLQKEQNLVTDEWPWPIQYRSATGYGCPDNAPCDSQYYGLTNQLKWSAHMFQAIMDNDSNWFTPYGVGVQDIKWNPNSSCGSSSVNVEGKSTSALYNYTPYQPNQAALNNLYGSGDDCSSYGNRNFWRLFNDWFGTTIGARSFTDVPEGQRRIQTVTLNGQIYIFYYDAFQGVLRMATQTSGWQFSVLDGSAAGGNGRVDANLGSDVTATTLGNSLQLFYYDKTHGDLRHAWTDTNGWHFEALDGSGGGGGQQNADLGLSPSVTTLNGGLQVYYYSRTQGTLRHAWTTTSTGWQFENLDGDPGSVSHQSGNVGMLSSVTTIGTSLQLLYYDYAQGNVRHAWTDTNGWHFENLDGDPGSLGHMTGNVGEGPIITTVGTSIQAFYYDQARGNLRHAWTDTNGWHFENLDGDPGSVSHFSRDLGVNTSVTVDSNNSIQVYYYDRDDHTMRHAWTDTNGWHFENMDGDAGSTTHRTANVGINSGVTIFNTSIQLYYFDRTNGNLRHAWTDNTGWHFEDLGPTVVY